MSEPRLPERGGNPATPESPGAPAVEAAQLKRRLTAIMMADVVGYSRLMSLDEDGTYARFGGYIRELIEPAIARYGGRPVRSMGDGLLVEFDSAIAAVRTALAIQSALSEREDKTGHGEPIRLRIGINTGDVIVDDRDIYGNSVNIAARLETLAGPGEIYATQSVCEQLRGVPDISFEDRGELQLKNIPHPVRVFRVVDRPTAGSLPARLPVVAAASKRWREAWRHLASRPRSGIPLLIALIAIGGSIAGISSLRDDASFLPRSSIMVLPFGNLSSDPGQEYFADAVTNDVTTDLSRMRHVLVISPGTAFTLKGKSLSPREIGEEVGARYLLRGGIRHVGEHVETNVQLVEAASGAQLWADRFTKRFVDLAKLEQEITGRIAASLNVQLVKAESRHAEQASAPDALDLRLRAEGVFFSSVTPQNTMEARRLLEQAVQRDPNAAEAWARLAEITASDYLNHWNKTGPEQLAAADAAAQKALELDPNLALAHLANGFIHKARGQHSLALVSFSRAIDLDPNLALAYAHKANTLIFLGRPDDALPLAEYAVTLSPHDPSLGIFYWIAGRAEFYAGRYDKAIPWLRKSVEVRQNLWYNRLHLVSAYALAGEIDEAKASLADFNKRFTNPVFTVATVEARERSDPTSLPFVIAVRNKFHDGLRLAGMAMQ